MSALMSPPFAVPPPTYLLRRLSVSEYHQMIQVGILTEDDPVELLEGWLVKKMPRNPPHDSTIDELHELLRSLLPAGWRVRVQSAITTGDSEPEPDLAVAPGPASRYADHHPGPAEIAFVIEVADSSLSRDWQEKSRLYARAGIVCYWIVNLPDRQVEVYTQPTGPAEQPHYQQRQHFSEADRVPVVIGGQVVGEVAVAQILPPPGA